MEEYIVSARKYRPMTFDSVVGQSALTTTLRNAVRSGKLAHAYLFCGPRGVGKTTCARIFAKAINCMSPTEEGEACNHCESCQAFNEQRSYNIFELDAASNNSVENIKSLMEQTRIPPQVGRYKVFIIDEVHMLSTQAFNAFLKTLEEPPSHVIFILATTEKHKILPTIISRCQIYDFERMTVQGTIDHLKMVAQKEGYTYEEEALAVIAEKADGGMRDALSIFDQVASFSQGNITYQKVIESVRKLNNMGLKVGAIQTTTRESLKYPKEIVRTYQKLGFESIFIRPLTPLGKAQMNWDAIGYTAEEYLRFYFQCLDELLLINQEGFYLKENHASILLGRIKGHFINYMELRSPCGAGIGQIAYYADGNIFTCDEGRMLYEMGSDEFLLGNINSSSYSDLVSGSVCKAVCAASILESIPSCCDCVYQPYCGTCPVVNFAQNGDILEKQPKGYRCQIYSGMLDYLFGKLLDNDTAVKQILDMWSD